MPVLGEIARKARENIPQTWHALAHSPAFGDAGLQGRVDATKLELFGTVVPYGQEVAIYGDLGTEYAGVATAIRLCIPGYDHWMAQATQFSATGKNETKTFTDRANALLRLRDEFLIPEERRLYPLVADLLVGVLTPRRQGVIGVGIPRDAEHVTPDPATFEPAWERPRGIA